MLPGTVPLGDYIASLFGAIGVLVALRHAEATGRGQVVDVGIYEAVFRLLEEIAAAYGLHGTVREREGSGSFVDNQQAIATQHSDEPALFPCHHALHNDALFENRCFGTAKTPVFKATAL